MALIASSVPAGAQSANQRLGAIYTMTNQTLSNVSHTDSGTLSA